MTASQLASTTSTSANATYQPGNAQAVVASDGTALVVYFDGSKLVYRSAASPYSSWSAATTLPSSGSNRYPASLHINTDNSVDVLYHVAGGQPNYVLLTKSGTTWSAGTNHQVTATSGSGSSGEALQILKDASGRLWAVINQTNTTFEVYYSTNGTTWTASITGAAMASATNAPFGAVCGNYLVVAWGEGTNGNLVWRRVDTTGTLTSWSANQSIQPGNVGGFGAFWNGDHYSFTADGNGNGILAWTDETINFGSGIWTATYNPATDTWGSITNHHTPPGGQQDNTPAVVNAGGDVYLFWPQYSAANSYSLQYRKWSASGGTWGTTTQLEAAGNNIQNLQAGYGNNTIFIMWAQGTATPWQVWFDTFSTSSSSHATHTATGVTALVRQHVAHTAGGLTALVRAHTAHSASGVQAHLQRGVSHTALGVQAHLQRHIPHTASGVHAQVKQHTRHTASGVTAQLHAHLAHTATGAHAQVRAHTAHSASGVAAQVRRYVAHTASGVATQIKAHTTHTAGGVTALVRQHVAHTAIGLTAQVRVHTAHTASGVQAQIKRRSSHTVSGVTTQITAHATHSASGVGAQIKRHITHSASGAAAQVKAHATHTATGVTAQITAAGHATHTATGVTTQINAHLSHTASGLTALVRAHTAHSASGVQTHLQRGVSHTAPGVQAQVRAHASHTASGAHAQVLARTTHTSSEVQALVAMRRTHTASEVTAQVARHLAHTATGLRAQVRAHASHTTTGVTAQLMVTFLPQGYQGPGLASTSSYQHPARATQDTQQALVSASSLTLGLATQDTQQNSAGATGGGGPAITETRRQ